MNEAHFLLYNHKKPIHIQLERISFYEQCQIIEAISENSEVYYLFFYKSNFLTAVKATNLRRNSFIEHALKKGVIFQAPHPLTYALLSSKHSYQINNYKQLLKKLETHYSVHEKAYILTFFESFFPKKALFQEIQSIFYEYRRNGQMFLGYRIVRILMDFAPRHSLVKQLAGDMVFSKYAVLYNQKSPKMFGKDIIFAEKTYFLHKENDHFFKEYEAILIKESRSFELISLYISKLLMTPADEYYNPLLKLLNQYFNEKETVSILNTLSYQLPNFLLLQQDLFNKYIKAKNMNAALNLIQEHNIKLSDPQVHSLADLLEQCDISADSYPPETLKRILQSVFTLFPDKIEKLLTQYVISLFKTNEILEIKDWLKSFTTYHGARCIIAKVDKMHKLSEELEDMQTLGEMYYELRQFDKAIECFSWEMELTPTNPKPLQWLAKAYREMGMSFESEAYQQMCISMQKRA